MFCDLFLQLSGVSLHLSMSFSFFLYIYIHICTHLSHFLHISFSVSLSRSLNFSCPICHLLSLASVFSIPHLTFGGFRLFISADGWSPSCSPSPVPSPAPSPAPQPETNRPSQQKDTHAISTLLANGRCAEADNPYPLTRNYIKETSLRFFRNFLMDFKTLKSPGIFF